MVTQTHARYYRTALAGVPASLVVEQPRNRGTAPAIVYALRRLGAVAPDDPVVLLPSDHYVSDDRAFMGQVEQALDTVAARRPSTPSWPPSISRSTCSPRPPPRWPVTGLTWSDLGDPARVAAVQHQLARSPIRTQNLAAISVTS